MLVNEVARLMSNTKPTNFNIESPQRLSVMVVGVNGSGKTTTVAKLAQLGILHKRRVMLGGADTFRAGAIEQISLWAKKLQVPVITNSPNSDPGSVVYDTLSSAQRSKSDMVLIDTAGRLQNRHNLMQELKKMQKILYSRCKDLSFTPVVLLVIDASTGQNGITQAKLFTEAVDSAGVIITKMDGSAKAGFALSIVEELKLPILWIGNGEALNNLELFSASNFAKRLILD